MSLRLYEKPPYPRYIRDRLKRYDRRLDLVWNKTHGRWEVWQTIAGRASIEFKRKSGASIEISKDGFCIEDAEVVKYNPPPKPFRVLIVGENLNENSLFGELWLRDVWKFKNNDALERDLVDSEQREKRREEKEIESNAYNIARDSWRYATNVPMVGYGGGRRA